MSEAAKEVSKPTVVSERPIDEIYSTGDRRTRALGFRVKSPTMAARQEIEAAVTSRMYVSAPHYHTSGTLCPRAARELSITIKCLAMKKR